MDLEGLPYLSPYESEIRDCSFPKWTSFLRHDDSICPPLPYSGPIGDWKSYVFHYNVIVQSSRSHGYSPGYLTLGDTVYQEFPDIFQRKHLTKAWEKRKADHTAMKAKGRVEDVIGLDRSRNPRGDLLPGQVVPIAAVLAKGFPGKKRDGDSSRMSSARPNLKHYLGSPARKSTTIDEKMEEARMRFVHNIPHLGLYLDYTDRRNQLEDEGFWDDLETRKTAHDLFNFQELDEAIRRMESSEETIKANGVDDQVTSHDDASRSSPDRHDSRSVHREDEAASKTSGYQSGVTVTRDTDRDSTKKVSFAGSAHLMTRFYSRLNEIRKSKSIEKKPESTTPSDAVPPEKMERRRIRTALRRLLTERLFPDVHPATPVKPLPINSGDADTAFASGTITPHSLGTRSKTTMSILSRNGDDNNQHSISGTKGQILLVESDTKAKRNEENEGANPDKQATLGYYRRHQMPFKKSNISRLYQPARSHTETNLSPKGDILKDPDFIKCLRAQIGQYNEGSDQPGRGGKNRPNMSWAYNHQPQRGDGTTDRRHKSSNQMSGKELEDWRLKNLLEELYQDKKYMDSLILTKADNATEEEITKSVEHGRQYLLDRAAYWLERGPQPPRPPTSALGLRLEREQSMMSSRNAKISKENEKLKQNSRKSSSSDGSQEENNENRSKGHNGVKEIEAKESQPEQQ